MSAVDPARGDLSAAARPDEVSYEERLRPQSLEEMVGQDALRRNLAVFVAAARERSEPLDHLLFYGPPGLGKTSLARIVAREMRATFRATSGPVLERSADLVGLLANIESGDVLFIDEIHRLPAVVEEVLYPALEDYRLDVMIGQGPTAQSVRVELPPFTLVGATTRAGLLTAPLRDRFGWSARLDYYAASDLVGVLVRSAGILGLSLDSEGAREIASRSRGTPRIANRLLRRVRDFAQVEGGRDAPVDARVARFALGRLEVDALGFDALDRALLLTLIEKFDGGPVGIDTLGAALGEDRGTLEDLVEPFLIQGGYLERTPRGRLATRRAFEHFGIEPGPGRGGQGRLF